MNQGKYVFSQLMELVSHKVFTAYVNRYKGDYKSKQFSCWKQFLYMAFCQLTHRESLSDTITFMQKDCHYFANRFLNSFRVPTLPNFATILRRVA